MLDCPRLRDPLFKISSKLFAATSPAIRSTLHAHRRLPTLLRALDALRGRARKAALERVLSVASDDAAFILASCRPANGISLSSVTTGSGSGYASVQEINLGSGPGPADGKVDGAGAPLIADAEDVSVLRTLAVVTESAVRS